MITYTDYRNHHQRRQRRPRYCPISRKQYYNDECQQRSVDHKVIIVRNVHCFLSYAAVIVIIVSIIIQHQCVIGVVATPPLSRSSSSSSSRRDSSIIQSSSSSSSSSKAIRQHNDTLVSRSSSTTTTSEQEHHHQQDQELILQPKRQLRQKLRQQQQQHQQQRQQQQQQQQRQQQQNDNNAEQQQQCRDQLVQADTDGDGKLILNEFTDYIQTSLVPTLINRAMVKTIIPELFTSLSCCSPQKLYLIQYFNTPLDVREKEESKSVATSITTPTENTTIIDVRKCCTFPNNKQLILSNTTTDSSTLNKNNAKYINLYLNDNVTSTIYYPPPDNVASITDYYILQSSSSNYDDLSSSNWNNNDTAVNTTPNQKAKITKPTDTTDYLAKLCQGIDQYFTSETTDGTIPATPTTQQTTPTTQTTPTSPTTPTSSNSNGGNDDNSNTDNTLRPVVVTKPPTPPPTLQPNSQQSIHPTESPIRLIITTNNPSIRTSTRGYTGSPTISSIVVTEIPTSNIIDTRTKIPSPLVDSTTTNYPTKTVVETTSAPSTNNYNLNSKNPSPSSTDDNPTTNNNPTTDANDPSPPADSDADHGGDNTNTNTNSTSNNNNNEQAKQAADHSTKKVLLVIVIVVGACILLVLALYFGYLEYQRQQRNKILQSSSLRRFQSQDNQSITQSADNSITQYHDIDPLFVSTGLSPPATNNNNNTNNDDNDNPTTTNGSFSSNNDKITQSIAEIISSSQSDRSSTYYTFIPPIGESIHRASSTGKSTELHTNSTDLLLSSKEQQQPIIDDEAEADIKTLFAGSVHDKKGGGEGGSGGSSSHKSHSSTSSIYIIQDEDLLTMFDQPIPTKNSETASTSVDATESTSTDVSSLYNNDNNQYTNDDTINHDLHYPILKVSLSSDDNDTNGDIGNATSNKETPENVHDINEIPKDPYRSCTSGRGGSSASVIHIGYGSDEQHILDNNSDNETNDWAENIGGGIIHDVDDGVDQDVITNPEDSSPLHQHNVTQQGNQEQNEQQLVSAQQYYPPSVPLHHQKVVYEQNNFPISNSRSEQQQRAQFGSNNDSIDSIFTHVDTLLMNRSLKLVQRRIHKKKEDMDIAVVSSSSSYSSSTKFRNPNELYPNTVQGPPRIVPVLSMSMKKKNHLSNTENKPLSQPSSKQRHSGVAVVTEGRRDQENQNQLNNQQFNSDRNPPPSFQGGNNINEISSVENNEISTKNHSNTSGTQNLPSEYFEASDSGFSDMATDGEPNTALGSNRGRSTEDENITASSETNSNITAPAVGRTYITDPRESFAHIQNLYSGQGGASSSSSSSSSSSYSSDNYTASSTDEQSIDLDRSVASGVSHDDRTNHDDGEAKSAAPKPTGPADIV